MPGTSCAEGFGGFSAASFRDSHPRDIKGWGASQVQLLNACMHRWGASQAQLFNARVHQVESILRAAPQCPCAPDGEQSGGGPSVPVCTRRRHTAFQGQLFNARVHQAESIPRAAPQCPCAPGSPGRVEQSSSSWTTLELSWDGLPTWEQLLSWEQLPHGMDPRPWLRASLKQRSAFFSGSNLAPTRSGSKAFPHRLCIIPSRVVLPELEVPGGCLLTR